MAKLPTQNDAFISFIKVNITPRLSEAVGSDDWNNIDNILLELEKKARSLGLFAPHFLMTEHEELWIAILDKVRSKVEEIFKFNFYDVFNAKELYNIVTPALYRNETEELLSAVIVRWGEDRFMQARIRRAQKSANA